MFNLLNWEDALEESDRLNHSCWKKSHLLGQLDTTKNTNVKLILRGTDHAELPWQNAGNSGVPGYYLMRRVSTGW